MTITITLDPSGPTKRQIIELGFGKITMPGYEFSKTADEIAEAMTVLSALMLEWPYNVLGFVQPTYGTGSADEASGISFEALNGVAAALALRLAAHFGRALPPAMAADLALSAGKLNALTATIPSMPKDKHTVRGAGVRGFGPFIEESAPVSASDDPGDLAGLID